MLQRGHPTPRQEMCCRSANPRHFPPGEMGTPFLAHWLNPWRHISELQKLRVWESSIGSRSLTHHSLSQSYCFDLLNPSPALIALVHLRVLPTVSLPKICPCLCTIHCINYLPVMALPPPSCSTLLTLINKSGCDVGSELTSNLLQLWEVFCLI